MEKQHALQRLEQLQKKLYAIHYACSAITWMPTPWPRKTPQRAGAWRWACWQARSSSS